LFTLKRLFTALAKPGFCPVFQNRYAYPAGLGTMLAKKHQVGNTHRHLYGHYSALLVLAGLAFVLFGEVQSFDYGPFAVFDDIYHLALLTFILALGDLDNVVLLYFSALNYLWG
jgi:hypothetical protein